MGPRKRRCTAKKLAHDAPDLLRDAVAPGTAKVYGNALEDFEAWTHAALDETHPVHRHAKPTSWRAELDFARGMDVALTEYFNREFAKGLAASVAGRLIAAVTHFHPYVRGSLPRAARAAKAWEKLRPSGEGGPMSERGVGLMAIGFLRQGGARADENALRTILAFDGMLRQGECDKLRREDVSIAGGQCALALGVVSRRERTKTGVRQGVCLRTEVAKATLAAHLRGLRSARTRVFTATTATSFRTDWRALTESLGLPTRPPHALRHAGASELVRAGWKIGDVKLRGRWQSDASVRRYTKEHELVAYDAMVSRLPGLSALSDAYRADALGVLARARG